MNFSKERLITGVGYCAEHIDVIGMVKKSAKIYYRYHGHSIHLMAIYGKLKKRRGRARILASTLVKLFDEGDNDKPLPRSSN